VRSALDCACAQPEGVEVIVVPSGDDASLEQSLAAFRSDRRLRVLPAVAGNANAARNAGMEEARGKYIRFLDDDDYLLPAASAQLKRAQREGLEICSGSVLCVDQDGADLGTLPCPSTPDFVQAVLGLSSLNLPVGNLFLRAACAAARWDPAVDRLQDLAWMCSLASLREWRWGQLEAPCGVWFQHSGPRVSSLRLGRHKSEKALAAILGMHKRLQAQGRLDGARAGAIARFLWAFVYSGFPFHPLHWHRIARIAAAINPQASAHRLAWVPRWLPAIAVEWMLLPARATSARIRMLLDVVRPRYRRML
jgi:hypothetical protein